MPVVDEPSPRWLHGALGGLSLVAFGWSLFITWTQHASLNTYLADVGSFHFLAGGPLVGEWLRTPVAWDVGGGNYWGIHFQPALFLITPFYLLHSGAMTLLAFLAAGVSLAAWPAGILARRLTGSNALAVGFAVAWSLNHFVGSVHLANHPEALAFPFWFLALLGAEGRRRGLLAVGLLGVLMVKEDMALYAALLGVGLMLDRESRRWGLAVLAAAVAWGVMALVVMKLSGAAAMAEAGATPASRFASFGDTPLSIAGGMLAQPVEVARRVLSPALLAVYGSLLFLSLGDLKRCWLPAAALFPILASDDALIRSLAYYYSYPALPLLFWTAMRGARRIMDAGGDRRWVEIALAVVVGLAGAVQCALPTRTDGLRRLPFAVPERASAVHDVLAFVPEDAPLAVQFDLYPQAPLRPVLVPFREGFLDRVDYVLLNQKRFPADLADKGQEFERCMLELQSGRWGVLIEEQGFILFERIAPPSSAP